MSSSLTLRPTHAQKESALLVVDVIDKIEPICTRNDANAISALHTEPPAQLTLAVGECAEARIIARLEKRLDFGLPPLLWSDDEEKATEFAGVSLVNSDQSLF